MAMWDDDAPTRTTSTNAIAVLSILFAINSYTNHPDLMPTCLHHGRAMLLLMGGILMFCAGREGGDGDKGLWFVYVFLCVWRDHKK